ncbi:MAG: Gfo/Idh/MocA family oxidoreductase [Chloroflexi bacterium]|nr:Gfo/Idh/MocA family oxidoreductase [Chloroflexota bacterium]
MPPSWSHDIGIAILGAGMVARYHLHAIEANADLGARLVAIGHHNPARFGEISAQFGVPCLDQQALLAHPAVDVVCICTPSGQHAAQAIAAARAGKHILVEKPMALSLADADSMIAAAQQAGVQLGVVLQRRVDPLFRRIYDAIQAGDLGRLTLGLVTLPYNRSDAYYKQAAWRGTWAEDGGGVLMNQGIHQVDLLLWYMGDPVKVQASANTLLRQIEVEDTLVATLTFDNGALATITATTTAAPGFPHRIEIYGTAGGIQVEGEGVVRWTVADPARATIEPVENRQPAAAGAGSDPKSISPSGHIAILRDLIQAVRAGRAPHIDGAEGRRSLAAVLAVYAAGLNPHATVQGD